MEKGHYVKTGLGLVLLASLLPAAGEEQLDLLDSLSLDQLLELEVSTSSRVNESQALAAGTLFVIPKEQIEQRRYHDLKDLLNALPGVEFSKNNVIRHNNVTVRGIVGSDKILFLRNGHRIYAPDGQRMPIDLNTSLHHVKQVEVMYGPGSSIYGADAFSMVVNLISEDYSNTASGLNIAATKGTHDFEKYRISGQFHHSDNLQLAFASHFHQHNNQYLVSEYPFDFILGDLDTFDGRTFKTAEQRSQPDFPIVSRSYFLEARLFEDVLITFNHGDFIHSTAEAEQVDSVDFAKRSLYYHENQSLNLSWQYQISDALKQAISLGYILYENEPRSQFSNTFNEYRIGYKYSKGEQKRFEHLLEWTITEQHSLLLGYTLTRLESIPKTNDLSVPFDTGLGVDEQLSTYINTNNELRTRIFQTKSTSKGLFSQWQSHWSEAFSTTLGLRYDHDSEFGSTVNPRVALNYAPNKQWLFKAMYGEAYLAPSPSSTWQHVGAFAFQRADGLYQSSFMTLPNPDLQPEEISTFELFSQWRVDESLLFSLSLFHNQLDDLIAGAATPEVVSDFVPGGVISHTETLINQGASTSYGASLSWHYITQYKDVGIELYGNYNYVDGDADTPIGDVPLPGTSKHRINQGLTLTSESWEGNLEWRSAADVSSPRLAHPDKSPGYGILDVAVNYKISANTRLALEIDNLLDKHFYFYDTAAVTPVLVPQPTRSVIFSVEMSW